MASHMASVLESPECLQEFLSKIPFRSSFQKFLPIIPGRPRVGNFPPGIIGISDRNRNACSWWSLVGFLPKTNDQTSPTTACQSHPLWPFHHGPKQKSNFLSFATESVSAGSVGIPYIHHKTGMIAGVALLALCDISGHSFKICWPGCCLGGNELLRYPSSWLLWAGVQCYRTKCWQRTTLAYCWDTRKSAVWLWRALICACSGTYLTLYGCTGPASSLMPSWCSVR